MASLESKKIKRKKVKKGKAGGSSSSVEDTPAEVPTSSQAQNKGNVSQNPQSVVSIQATLTATGVSNHLTPWEPSSVMCVL